MINFLENEIVFIEFLAEELLDLVKAMLNGYVPKARTLNELKDLGSEIESMINGVVVSEDKKNAILRTVKISIGVISVLAQVDGFELSLV